MATPVKEHNPNLLPPADWAGEIEQLQEALRNERDRNLRTLADFKNYRRRIEHDGNKVGEEANRKLFLSLLDIVDDFERAVLWTAEDERPVIDGVRIIHQKLLALLEKEGVRPVSSVGKKFDPELHQAVAVATRAEVEHGTIVDELRRGYLWNNKLLRAAQVRIAE